MLGGDCFDARYHFDTHICQTGNELLLCVTGMVCYTIWKNGSYSTHSLWGTCHRQRDYDILPTYDSHYHRPATADRRIAYGILLGPRSSIIGELSIQRRRRRC